VTRHFDEEAAWWSTLYEDESLAGLVFGRRRDMVLEWIDELRLPPGTRALEVGCGSGVLAVELARRDLQVDAVDLSPALVDATQRRADAAGVGGRLAAGIGDAARLDFADDSFALVVAVAVLPWVESTPAVLAEVARVLAPGGHAVLTAVNRARLDYLLDPRRNPYLAPLRQGVAELLARAGLRSRRELMMRFHGRRELERQLQSAGLQPLRSATVGFWDFSILGRAVSERRARRAHLFLQRLADGGAPLVRDGGANRLVLARSVARSPGDGAPRRGTD
jgi:ubiquinone/menaquinone biosynthesis C-methylase UbiE